MTTPNTVPLLHTRWFSILLCKTWFFGYQISKTTVLRPSYEVIICVVPFIGIRIGVRP